MDLLREYVRDTLHELFGKDPRREYQKIVEWASKLAETIYSLKHKARYGMRGTEEEGPEVAFYNIDKNIRSSIKFLEKNIENFADDPNFETTWRALESGSESLRDQGGIPARPSRGGERPREEMGSSPYRRA